MKITRLETFSTPFVSLLRLTGEDGSEGWGQLSPYHADTAALILHKQVAPWVLGQTIDNIADIDELANRVFEKEHKFPGSYLCRAFTGVDTALFDWLGKKAGQPVCVLLGGKPKPLRAYASSMRRDITPQDEAKRFCHLRQTHGYDAFKFRVGSECGRNRDEWQGRTEAMAKTLRHALGDDIDLLADANSAYDPPTAIAVGKQLQDNGVRHFEEPCPYWRPDWTKQVTAGLQLQVAGGEQDNNLALWRYMLDDRVINIAQPDIAYLGGVARTLRLVKMANAAGTPITPHSANLSLVTIFTLHLMAAIDGAGPYVEFSIEDETYYPWQYGLYDDFPVAMDGRVAVPQAPGWGVRIREDWLQKARYDCSALDGQ